MKYPAIRKRKTRCPQGHRYIDINTEWDFNKDGKPYQKCKRCRAIRMQLKYRNNAVFREQERRKSQAVRLKTTGASQAPIIKETTPNEHHRPQA